MSDTKHKQISDRFEKFEPPDGVDWREYNRDRIEREAESDAPDAWVFERLLQSLDEEGDS